MNIQELRKQYAKQPQVSALATTIEEKDGSIIFLEGLLASSAPLLFSCLAEHSSSIIVFILQDAEESSYFYHDLVQLMGDQQVLFFPSSYRRSVKYAQRDAANEILRTEVLSLLSSLHSDTLHQQGEVLSRSTYIVTYPEAVSEMVVSKRSCDSRTLSLATGKHIATST